MTLLVLSIVMILVLAWIVDLLLSEESVVRWRKSSAAMRNKFREMDILELTLASNVWFLGLFEAVYGERCFSCKRLIRSIISTAIAMTLVALVIEFFELPGFHVLHRSLISIAAILIVINLIADYLSLQETYWIMKFSQNKKFRTIVALIVLDLILTSLIYSGTVIIVGYIIYKLQDYFVVLPSPRYDLLDVDTAFGIYLGILFGSTYVTSTLWIGFATSAIGVRVLQALSPQLRRIIRVIGESEKPAFATAGFVCIAAVLIFGTYRITHWFLV